MFGFAHDPWREVYGTDLDYRSDLAGREWLTAGWHKVMDGFDATGFIKGAIAKAGGEHPAVQGWYAAFLEGFALPNVELFNFLVAWGEV